MRDEERPLTPPSGRGRGEGPMSSILRLVALLVGLFPFFLREKGTGMRGTARVSEGRSCPDLVPGCLFVLKAVRIRIARANQRLPQHQPGPMNTRPNSP